MYLSKKTFNLLVDDIKNLESQIKALRSRMNDDLEKFQAIEKYFKVKIEKQDNFCVVKLPLT